MKYFLVVGETSGDAHAAHLMQGLQRADGEAVFRYFGGDAMQRVAPGCVLHTRELAIMGFWEVATHLGSILRNLRLCVAEIAAFRPDVVILVDFPGFNFRIAKRCKQLGYKVFYYIAPKVWAWKESRIRLIQRYVDELFVIFPFEIAYFRRHGIGAHYEGNPLMDELPLDGTTATSGAAFNAAHGLDARPKVALLPGSRTQEIKAQLPPMVELAHRHPEYQFVVAGAPSMPDALYSDHLGKDGNIALVRGATHALMQHAVAGVITSGTATLEAALLGLPQVVVYRGNALSIAIARRFGKVPFISLVNLITGHEVVRELIQQDYNPTTLREELAAILPEGRKRSGQLAEYSRLAQMLGAAGVSDRLAHKMYHMLQGG